MKLGSSKLNFDEKINYKVMMQLPDNKYLQQVFN